MSKSDGLWSSGGILIINIPLNSTKHPLEIPRWSRPLMSLQMLLWLEWLSKPLVIHMKKKPSETDAKTTRHLVDLSRLQLATISNNQTLSARKLAPKK